MIILNQPVATAGQPLTDAKRALVMLHGRGDRAEAFVRFSEQLKAPDFVFLAPQAIQNVWYPHGFMTPITQNEPQLSLSLSGVHEVIDNLMGLHFRPEDIYLLGFSQGASLSLEFGARNARCYGGIIAFTGGLLGDTVDVSNYQGDFGGTPVFIGSSDRDPYVPEQRIDESEVILKQLGADVTKKIYPGMGHTINADEIQHANTILNKS